MLHSLLWLLRYTEQLPHEGKSQCHLSNCKRESQWASWVGLVVEMIDDFFYLFIYFKGEKKGTQWK